MKRQERWGGGKEWCGIKYEKFVCRLGFKRILVHGDEPTRGRSSSMNILPALCTYMPTALLRRMYPPFRWFLSLGSNLVCTETVGSNDFNHENPIVPRILPITSQDPEQTHFGLSGSASVSSCRSEKSVTGPAMLIHFLFPPTLIHKFCV